MDDKSTQAAEAPVPAADQAPNQHLDQAPTASAELGADDATAAVSNTDATTPTDAPTSELVDSPTPANTQVSEPRDTGVRDTDSPDENTNPKTHDSEHKGPSLGTVAAVGAALGAAALGAAAFNAVRHRNDEQGERNDGDGSIPIVADASPVAPDDAPTTSTNANETQSAEARDDLEAQNTVETQNTAETQSAEVQDTDKQAVPSQDVLGQSGLEADTEGSSEPENMTVDAVMADTPAAETEQMDAATMETPATETSAMETSAMETSAMETMTMEDVLAASDEQLAKPPVHRGMILTGSVIMLAQDGIIVDVGAKIEGLLPYNQLFEFDTNAKDAAKYFKSGDDIQVYIVRADIPNNTIILSKKRADQERAWNLLQDIHEKNLPVEVEIVDKVRGGLVANLGVRAFLPASQVDIRRVNDLAPYVGQRLKVKIIELNRKRNRVIVSRRAILEEEVAGLKEETLAKLEPGLQIEGEVVEITDFGVFVNLGGVDGLVHRSELSHGRFNHPREVVKLGDKLKVEVLDMDLERERINLSAKKLAPDPWENALLNYSIGQRVEGKVTNLTPFGAFVEIEPGLEGLIHVSEMSWTKRIRHPKEVLTEGEDVETMVLKIDTEQQRISLGLRQTQPDPWSSLPDRYPPGTEVTGPITGITDFGVFMEIEEGIEGLVHISELAHEHIETIEEHFNKGDEVTAVILNIDPVEQRASLSRKRLLPFSAGEGDADMALGAPASRGGGRKGRRGGRRSQVIDYDYSYAASDTNTKATTKLGDVYADLFAQFGLTDTKKDSSPDAASQDSAAQDASAQDSAAQDSAPAETATAPSDSSSETSRSETSQATKTPEQTEPQAQQAATAETAAAEDEIDPENAIDAAEAAALLTAAFREGKRPAPATADTSNASSQANDADDKSENDTNEDDTNEGDTNEDDIVAAETAQEDASFAATNEEAAAEEAEKTEA